MTRVPDKVSALLKRLTEELPVALGQNLVGLYVYGSLTQRAFDARRSDIDCIAVTRQGLSQAQFKKLAASLARLSESEPWAARLQITLLSRHEILTRDSKACLYQFGVLKRIRSDGNPIIWMNVLRSGIVLTGPQPRSFVPAITREMLLRALEREVGYLRDEICAKQTSEWRCAQVSSLRGFDRMPDSVFSKDRYAGLEATGRQVGNGIPLKEMASDHPRRAGR